MKGAFIPVIGIYTCIPEIGTLLKIVVKEYMHSYDANYAQDDIMKECMYSWDRNYAQDCNEEIHAFLR